MVQAVSAAFPTPHRWLVLVMQCHPDGMSCPDGHTWLASTTDAGRHWSVQPSPSLAGELTFADGRDGWAEAGGRNNAVMVTHDGGSTWERVTIPNGYGGGVSLSVAAGKIWALAQPSDIDVSAPPLVLRGRATGSTLEPVPGRQDSDGPLVAGGADIAYVQGMSPLEISPGTADAGRHWYDQARACPWPDYAVPSGPPGANGSELVQDCRATKMYRGVPKMAVRRPFSILERSTDGGRRWTRYPDPHGVGNPTLVSTTVAWARCDSTEICRSVDGGRTWKLVWEPTARTGIPDVVVATSPSRAAAVISLSSGGRTSMLVVSTSDGGRHWTSTPLRLPDR